MSLLNVVPDSVTAAAGNLQDIGSAVGTATAAAAAQTTAIAAPAEDEVSVAIAALFGAHARGFQAAQAEAAAFHNQFVKLLGAAGSTYAGAEAVSASSLWDQLKLNWEISKFVSQGWNDLTSGKGFQDFSNWAVKEFSDVAGSWTIDKIIGGDTTWLGIRTGFELGLPYGPPGILAGVIGGGVIGHYIPDALKYGLLHIPFIQNLQGDISSWLNQWNPFSPPTGGTPTGGTGWYGLGPSIAITSDVVGPWGADGIQQDVTGVFDFGAGPFAVQVGSFSGMSAADMYGGMASVNATAFGIRESGSVYGSNGGAPQFSFSVDVPAVTGLLQDFAPYLP